VIAELLAGRQKRLEGRGDKLEDSLRRWADEEPALLGALAKLELNGKLGGHRQRARLRRRLRELQGRMHAARRSLEPKEAHALRIAVKKLRYDAELAEPALPEAAGKVLEALVPLQDPLGELHDCDVRLAFLDREMKKRGEDDASSALRTRELARRVRLGQKVAEDLARFRDESVPRALRKELS
jgi:CHAD domain-containing protein